jgi:hypothetical protein
MKIFFGRGWEEEREMTQTLYAHMNKKKIKKKIFFVLLLMLWSNLWSL